MASQSFMKGREDSSCTKPIGILSCDTVYTTYSRLYIEVVTSIGVLISPYPDLLPDVFCLTVRIFRLMLVLLYIYIYMYI